MFVLKSKSYKRPLPVLTRDLIQPIGMSVQWRKNIFGIKALFPTSDTGIIIKSIIVILFISHLLYSEKKIEFLAIECQRISRKLNISAA